MHSDSQIFCAAVVEECQTKSINSFVLVLTMLAETSEKLDELELFILSSPQLLGSEDFVK
jgi:hypothetical protein